MASWEARFLEGLENLCESVRCVMDFADFEADRSFSSAHMRASASVEKLAEMRSYWRS